MSDVKWIKILVNIFDDEKIRYIETLPNGDETIVIWFRILCLAGKSNSDGLLMMTDRIAYTEDMLASIFNRDIKSIQLALGVFAQLEMVEIVDNKIYISNWEKHQNINGLERIREQTRQRNIAYRERKKEVTLLPESTEEPESFKAKRFVPPTLEEVQAYIAENKYRVNAEKFINFYESKGWLVGKVKMKDWKSAVRSWNSNTITEAISMTGKRVEPIPDYQTDRKALSDDEVVALKAKLANINKNGGEQ